MAAIKIIKHANRGSFTIAIGEFSLQGEIGLGLDQVQVGSEDACI